MSVLTDGMPVNYYARYAGDVRRVLDELDTLDETRPRVRRPLQYVLRHATPQGEEMLALLLVRAYRRGLLP